jgi:hypothetical protein
MSLFRAGAVCVAMLAGATWWAAWASGRPARAATVITLPTTVQQKTLMAIAAASMTPDGAVVIIDASAGLRPEMSTTANRMLWHEAVKGLNAVRLTVVIERPVATGQGGALLFALAGTRIAVMGATVTKLPVVLLSRKDVPGACGTAICTRVAAADLPVADAPAGTVVILPGQRSVPSPAVRPSAPAPGPVRGSPAARSPVPSRGFPWLLVILAALLSASVGWIIARWALRHRAAGRAGPDGPPREPEAGGEPDRLRPPGRTPPPEAVAPGPGEGIVATALHPEGYVEIDGLLYRATWPGPEASPEPGTLVAVEPVADRGLVAIVADRGGLVSGGHG